MRYGIVALAVVLLGGCYTVSGVRNTPAAEGDERLYHADVRTAALAVRNAVISTALQVVEAAPRGDSQWYLMARGPNSEMVRVLCEDLGDGVVAVRIILRSEIFEGHWDWIPTLFAQVDLELERALD